MKKILTLTLLIMLVATLSVTASASSNDGLIFVYELIPEEDYNYLGEMNLQTGKGAEADTHGGVLGLGPIDNGDGTFSDAFISFPVEVADAGLYDLTIRYAAKPKDGQIRCADAIVNDGERIHLDIVGIDWNTYFDTVITVELNAGMNTLTLKNVEGFDNSTYKSINILSLYWEPHVDPSQTTETEEPETEAPETEKPESDKPSTDAPDKAPGTTEAPAEEKAGCGSSLASAVVVFVSVLGCATVKRR